MKDSTVHTDQPVVFVFANTTGFDRDKTTGHLIPIRPWKQDEFWRGGERIEAEEARRLIENDPKLPVPFGTPGTWWRDN